MVLAILKDPFNELRNIPNYLILNLAVCDLVAGIPSELLLGALHFRKLTPIYYTAYTGLYLSMIASALTILALAFERFIVVVAPLQQREFLIYSHIKLAIVYIWLISASIAFLPIVSVHMVPEYRMIITNFIGIPVMLFMFVIYLKIFIVVRRCLYKDLDKGTIGERRSLIGGSVEWSDRRGRRERAVALSVFLFVGVFCLCWSPCFVAENVFYWTNERHATSTVANWIRFSGLLNSALNPVIYALRYVKFRRAVGKIIQASIYRPENAGLL